MEHWHISLFQHGRFYTADNDDLVTKGTIGNKNENGGK